MPDIPSALASLDVARAGTYDRGKAADARADVQAAVETFGGLDVLVYCAANQEPAGSVIELDEAAWNDTLAVNLTGAFLVSKAALPAIIRRGGGSVILTASQLGRVGIAGRPAYCATKGALIQLAKVMAVDHAAAGRLENELAAAGLSMAKVGVLRILAGAEEPMPLSELAEHSRCVRSNMTQLVDRLETEEFQILADAAGEVQVMVREGHVELRGSIAAGGPFGRPVRVFVQAGQTADAGALEVSTGSAGFTIRVRDEQGRVLQGVPLHFEDRSGATCGLPAGTIFQCPLPWWDKRETHWVLRTPAEMRASMTSKYVRELAMELFNRFWQRHVPGLTPTKGYPEDAKRFRRDIARAQEARDGSELFADDSLEVRARRVGREELLAAVVDVQDVGRAAHPVGMSWKAATTCPGSRGKVLRIVSLISAIGASSRAGLSERESPGWSSAPATPTR